MHFDGSNGQTTTIDQSSSELVYTMANGGALTTNNPKFGTASLNCGTASAYLTPICISSPYSAGSLQDIYATNAWTIESWQMLPVAGILGNPAIICSYGDNAALNGSTTLLEAQPNSDGLTGAWNFTDFNAFEVSPGNTVVQSPQMAMVVGTWYHVAIVNIVTVGVSSVTLYINGVNVANNPNSVCKPANYTFRANSRINLGSFAEYNGLRSASQIDDFRVSNIARYTANFVPPTAPFAGPC